MQLPPEVSLDLPVDPGLYLDRLVAPQPQGPVTQGRLKKAGIQGVDSIKSQGTVPSATPQAQFLFVNPHHESIEKSHDVLHHSGRVLAAKLQSFFPGQDSEGNYVVPTIDFRAQVLNVYDRRIGIGKPVFKLAPIGHEQLFNVIAPGL